MPCAPRPTSYAVAMTRHSTRDAQGNLNGHTHAPNFGRRVADCPRCDELANGAPAKEAPRWVTDARSRDADALALSRAIQLHDCAAAGCSYVCVRFDW